MHFRALRANTAMTVHQAQISTFGKPLCYLLHLHARRRRLSRNKDAARRVLSKKEDRRARSPPKSRRSISLYCTCTAEARLRCFKYIPVAFYTYRSTGGGASASRRTTQQRYRNSCVCIWTGRCFRVPPDNNDIGIHVCVYGPVPVKGNTVSSGH